MTDVVATKFLIAGLGNIGVEYAGTRHNIGFDVLDALAAKHQQFFVVERLAEKVEIKVAGECAGLYQAYDLCEPEWSCGEILDG